MKKPVILITKPESLGELSALQKAHVKGYTRSDGTFVKEHDTSVTAKPKAEGFGRGDKVKVHKPGQISRGEYEAHAGKADQKPAGGAAKPKHSAATLSALADQHEAESERQDKLATKKGANHPDYEKHVIASAHHAEAQRHAEKARDAKDEGERDAHLEAHARYKALAEKAEASVGAAPTGSKKGGYVAPKDGEVGHSEHTQYGAYFRNGDKVRDGSGKEHEVMEHRGAEVKTYGGGSFHPTKLTHVSSKAGKGR